MVTTERSTGEQREADEPGYQYGMEMRESPEYRGRSWHDVEPALRSHWEKRYDDRPWDRFSQPIKEAWEGMDSQGSDEADRRRFDEEHAADRQDEQESRPRQYSK